MPPSPELEQRIRDLMDKHGFDRAFAESQICAMDWRQAVDDAGGNSADADRSKFESLRPETWKEG